MFTVHEIPEQVRTYLNEHTSGYNIILHQHDQTARETAADTRTPELEFAKTVILRVDLGRPRTGSGFAIAVLPANHRIDLDKLGRALDATVVLTSESAIRELFPDCEVGAEPPLGNLYGLPVYVSAAMAQDESITFNAGTHNCAIEMRYADFERLVQPRVINFSVNEESYCQESS